MGSTLRLVSATQYGPYATTAWVLWSERSVALALKRESSAKWVLERWPRPWGAAVTVTSRRSVKSIQYDGFMLASTARLALSGSVFASSSKTAALSRSGWMMSPFSLKRPPDLRAHESARTASGTIRQTTRRPAAKTPHASELPKRSRPSFSSAKHPTAVPDAASAPSAYAK